MVVLYPTDEEDCYAIRQIVLAPGKSIAFRSPWLINPKDDVFLLAFFLDAFADAPTAGAIRSPSRRPANRPPRTRSMPRSTGYHHQACEDHH